jgi:hypothetical protein
LESGSGVDLLFLNESEIHLHRHLTRMWMKRGERAEIPALGTDRKVPIYSALNFRTNELTARVGAWKNAIEFLGVLAQLARDYRRRPCILVLDNASYHTAAIVKQYLDGTPPFR